MNRDRERIAGLILAAGASTRMGQPKQLLRVGGKTLIERVVSEALKSDLDTVVLVLGHRAEEIRAALGQIAGHPKLKIIENRQYRHGMSSSIIAGLSEVEESHGHVMILLGDMPQITSDLINLLLYRYLDSSLPIGAISIKAKRSHPVIISRELYHELQKLKGDVGARSLFWKYSERVCLVEPEFFCDNRDIDTQEDYSEYRKSLD